MNKSKELLKIEELVVRPVLTPAGLDITTIKGAFTDPPGCGQFTSGGLGCSTNASSCIKTKLPR